jgi:hypothetical protein
VVQKLRLLREEAAKYLKFSSKLHVKALVICYPEEIETQEFSTLSLKNQLQGPQNKTKASFIC